MYGELAEEPPLYPLAAMHAIREPFAGHPLKTNSSTTLNARDKTHDKEGMSYWRDFQEEGGYPEKKRKDDTSSPMEKWTTFVEV